MPSSVTQRLPGFRFEAKPPPLQSALPRMDIPVFVGFAASGPLHQPVPVEDAAQFAAIFGAEVPLAWDGRKGEVISALLASTVEAFFRNGGARCWIIRVADENSARCNAFPIPGLLRAVTDIDGVATMLQPAFALSRSQGSWSDEMRVSAALVAQPQGVLAYSPTDFTIDLARSPGTIIAPGDLVRLTFGSSPQLQTAFLVVRSVEDGPQPSPPSMSGAPGMRIIGDAPFWFDAAIATNPPSGAQVVGAFIYNQDTGSTSSGFESERFDVVGMNSGWNDALNVPTLTIDLEIPLTEAPAPGSFVRVDCRDIQLFLSVESVGQKLLMDSPPHDVVTISGPAFAWTRQPPTVWPSPLTLCERLSFDLLVRDENGTLSRMTDLGFASQNVRFWNNIPVDAVRYSRDLPVPNPNQSLYDDASSATPFPLAGSGQSDSIFLPIAIPIVPENYLGPIQLSGTPLQRDGLATFGARLFLDEDLVATSSSDLMNEADLIRFTGNDPRPLRGIHAALSIDEATIIAVPDSGHRTWHPIPEAVDGEIIILSPPSGAGQEGCCASASDGGFVECDPAELPPAPILTLFGQSTSRGNGSYTLGWAGTGDPFVLEESLLSTLSDAVPVYVGRENRFVLYGRIPGNYYYRVKAMVAGVSGNWSAAIHVWVAPEIAYQMDDEAEFTAGTLLAVQRALVRMAFSRGDLFAVLSLPQHFREDDTLAFMSTLKSPSGPFVPVTEHVSSAPLGLGESGCWSFAGIYFPWLESSQSGGEGNNRTIPPDGCACGVIARRSLDRGAWIAPANEPLSGIIALRSMTSTGNRLLLQDAQVNVVLQQPQGFVSQSALTLSDDPALRQINVRRLLSLLRRLALRLGVTYVFEPNDESFRRLVQRSFESLLGQLYSRGAFAGSTPATSYQVVTGANLNTPGDADLGRFFVELRVAPSLPLTFLVVRLVQTGDRAFIAEGA